MAMRLIKSYGVVASHHSKELKLQLIWNENKEKQLALISYKDGMSVNVTPFTKEEVVTLKKLLEGHLDYKRLVTKQEEKKVLVTNNNEKSVPENKTVHTLVSITATDINYQTALRSATIEEIEEAIEWMKADTKGKHATRIKFCEQKLNTLKKRVEKTTEETTKAEPSVKKEKPAPKEKAKILTFPTEDKKPKFYPLQTTGEHTYEECVEKLTKEREMFKDADSQYVINGLIELAMVDQDFRNNIMRDDKSYGGFMEYMSKAAQNGYCVKYGNVGWIDRDTGLGMAIDYYNNDEEKVKAEEEAKRKAEAEKIKKEAEKRKKETAKKKKTKTKTKSTPKKGGVIIKTS